MRKNDSGGSFRRPRVRRSELAGLVGGKHFIVDTSRNGLGQTPDSQWCNPSRGALGLAKRAAY